MCQAIIKFYMGVKKNSASESRVSAWASRKCFSQITTIHKQAGKGQADVFGNVIKYDFKSKNPTTNLGDINILK